MRPPSKTAVVLFNLGGPDSLAAVRPFLFNLFNDSHIISLPQPMRYMLAQFISRMRNKKAQHIYSLIGGRSPIVAQTEEQRSSLEKALQLHGDFKVFYSMRYWHPMAAEVVEEVNKFKPDKVILLPLYPHFSTSTTASSIEDWQVHARGLTGIKEISICCYPTNSGFVDAYAELIAPMIKKASKLGKPRVLFSAHGLPVKNITNGDPYQWQIEKSVEAIVKKLAIRKLDYKVCYQSRVGRLEWLKPYIQDEISAAANDKVPLVVVPISFVSEHSETLVELDIEYKQLSEEKGVPGYFRVPTVTTHPKFIEGLVGLCLQHLAKPSSCPNICPIECSQCFCKNRKL